MADEVRGEGTAAGGAVRVTVGAGGRIDELHLEPRLLGSGVAAIADAIREAVNAAHDDAARKPDGAMQAFETELDRLSDGFERAIEKVTKNLAEAQKRLEQ
ncbi:YbaB/EbfC family nucleoid-associated protein [Saccharopolyspora spinosa]|uniref:YbaB/EbfC DNA-binding family protein n=2 Tax=Saccharopolyspora spinosa TaxID=60894 RepID=A0A2N3Y8R4_SACSN|nr:YbaB/EbfC family nucleoid-associated protein [Saccharopolyspora spinosa]PKW19312.1 YbaB/EbfC DNA-binding family protein [Saccharopolyspora spinosa]